MYDKRFDKVRFHSIATLEDNKTKTSKNYTALQLQMLLNTLEEQNRVMRGYLEELGYTLVYDEDYHTWVIM